MSDLIQYFDVTGMTCGNCVSRVQKTLAKFAETAIVSLEPQKAVLVNATADLDTLNIALETLGKYRLIAQEPTMLPVASLIESNPPIKSLMPLDLQLSWLKTYQPLLILFSYIFIVCLAVEIVNDSFLLHRFMPHFMAGFFLSFSFFKLLDLKSFASSYAMYDLLAMHAPIYGFIYPFIELGLGMAYVMNAKPFITNLVTVIVMTFSTFGVLKAVLNKQKIRCACLGAVFNLPMSTVTIIEDILMVIMALLMLI